MTTSPSRRWVAGGLWFVTVGAVGVACGGTERARSVIPAETSDAAAGASGSGGATGSGGSKGSGGSAGAAGSAGTTGTGGAIGAGGTADASVDGSPDASSSSDAASNADAATSPVTSGQAATLVLGQADFTSAVTGTPEKNLNAAFALAIDSSHGVWVSDDNNSRVLHYASPVSSDQAADMVVGQVEFGTGTCQHGSASVLCNPAGLAFDGSGNLWVTDQGNNRVLRFSPPFTTGKAADLVLGQPDFTGSSASNGSSTASNFWNPTGVTFSPSGVMFVADGYGNRVLRFTPPFSNGQAADLVLGQPDFTTHNIGTVNAAYLGGPSDVALDSAGNVWVSDNQENRVLEYQKPLSNGMAATLVLGQTDFGASTPGPDSTGLGNPNGLSFDLGGSLWVADSAKNRAVRFDPPFSTGMSASVVLGQSDLSTDTGTTTATGLKYPTGVLVDPAGRVWIADYGNNRVLAY